MDFKRLQSILKIGETIVVEFKRCGHGIENSADGGLTEEVGLCGWSWRWRRLSLLR